MTQPLRRKSRRAFLYAGWIFIALGLLVVFAALRAPTVERTIDVSTIAWERGAAYIAPISPKVSLVYAIRGSLVGKKPLGRLVVLENGIPLGPQDAQHDDIRRSGAGAYSYWGHDLYFSSSDGSDPRTNGRAYSYNARATLKPAAKAVGIVAWLLGLVFLAISSRRAPADTDALDVKSVSFVRRLGWMLAIAGVTSGAILVSVPWLMSSKSINLQSQDVRHGRGLAYVAELPETEHWPWRRARKLHSWTVPRHPQLLENGVPISRITSGLQEVIGSGAGAISYVSDGLAFSTSDRTDPRNNGRQYEFRVPAEASPVSLLGAMALLVSGVLLVLYGRLGEFARAISRIGTTSAHEPSAPANGIASQGAYAVMAFSIGVPVALVVSNWWQGISGHLGAASYFPVSDAMGYFRCALSLGVQDTLNASGFGEWCSRRAVYPSMLSSLLGISGWRPSVALILQAGIIGFAIGLLVLVVQRSFGWLTALVCGLGLLGAAQEFSLGNFMTESMGLPAGLAGLSLLLLAVSSHQPKQAALVFGLALISFGMAARAGAVLVLPMLGLWAFFATREMARGPRARLLVLAAIALGTGLAFQYALVFAFGMDPRNTGGNAAASLYGLSTGSRDWSQAYRDFAALFSAGSETAAFRQIQAAALENIRAQPEIFLQSLFAAGLMYSKDLFGIAWMDDLNVAATFLLIAGTGICLFNVRQARYSLLLAFVLGEFLSAPFVIDSGGHRVFAVTLAGRLIVVGLAASWLLFAVSSARVPAFRQDGGTATILVRNLVWMAGGLGAGLIALGAAPATPIFSLLRLDTKPMTGICQKPEREVVARIGRESIQLTMGNQSLPIGSETLGVAPGKLESDPSSRRAWWVSELTPQPYKTTLIYALQRAGAEFGTFVPAYARGPLPISPGQFVALCVLEETDQPVKLGDLRFQRITQITQAEDLAERLSK